MSNSATKPLNEAVRQTWVAKWGAIVAFTSLVALGSASAATPTGDLSRYRNFQLGMDLATVAKQADASVSQVKVVHSRPALIQELEWRPQPFGASAQTEPAKDVVFSFYDGVLFRIVVNYDRYQTEGLTAADFVDAISGTYGPAAKAAVRAKATTGSYGDQEEILAQWQDSQYRFELIRSSYGPTYRLVGVLKRLEAPAQAATAEAARLDDSEAPQREAAKAAKEKDTERVRLEQARLVNKPKFRP